MKKTIFTFFLAAIVGLTANAQDISGDYVNSQTTWSFKKMTGKKNAYDYVGYNSTKNKISEGYAYYDPESKDVLLILSRTDKKDDYAYVVSKLDGNILKAKTLDPDGKVRWTGQLTKK